MANISDIQPHMDVIGSDGARIGAVDRVEGDRIKLERRGSADGEHHYVPLSAVSRVDSHVHLSATAAALGLAAAAGAAHAAGGSDTHNPLPPIANPAVKGAHPRNNYYLPWVLLGLALLALLFLLVKGMDKDDDHRDRAQNDTVATRPLAVERVELPNGRKVDLAPDSFNYGLQRYLESNEPTPRAFTFDKLNFDTASAAIRAEDGETVDTLAQILKAYPNARARVVGYTDAEGSASGNAALGQLRADAVAASLVEKGVAKSRLEAVSGGEANPAASNRSREGQAENRRTELVVTAK